MSSKTIAEKLLIKPNTTVWLSHPDRAGLIEPLPDGAVLSATLGTATVGLVFAESSAALRDVLNANKPALAQGGARLVFDPRANRIDVTCDSL